MNQILLEVPIITAFALFRTKWGLRTRAVGEKHGFVVEHEKRAVEHKPAVRKDREESDEAEDRPEDLERLSG